MQTFFSCPSRYVCVCSNGIFSASDICFIWIRQSNKIMHGYLRGWTQKLTFSMSVYLFLKIPIKSFQGRLWSTLLAKDINHVLVNLTTPYTLQTQELDDGSILTTFHNFDWQSSFSIGICRLEKFFAFMK